MNTPKGKRVVSKEGECLCDMHADGHELCFGFVPKSYQVDNAPIYEHKKCCLQGRYKKAEASYYYVLEGVNDAKVTITRHQSRCQLCDAITGCDWYVSDAQLSLAEWWHFLIGKPTIIERGKSTP